GRGAGRGVGIAPTAIGPAAGGVRTASAVAGARAAVSDGRGVRAEILARACSGGGILPLIANDAEEIGAPVAVKVAQVIAAKRCFAAPDPFDVLTGRGLDRREEDHRHADGGDTQQERCPLLRAAHGEPGDPTGYPIGVAAPWSNHPVLLILNQSRSLASLTQHRESDSQAA